MTREALSRLTQLLQRGRRSGLRPRLGEGIEVGELAIRENLLVVRRHLQTGRAHIARERRIGKTVRSEPRTRRRRSLRFAAVALRAADSHEEETSFLAAPCGCRRCRLR